MLFLCYWKMSKVETVVFLIQSTQYLIQNIISDCEFLSEENKYFTKIYNFVYI